MVGVRLGPPVETPSASDQSPPLSVQVVLPRLDGSIWKESFSLPVAVPVALKSQSIYSTFLF